MEYGIRDVRCLLLTIWNVKEYGIVQNATTNLNVEW